jgi:hypothetical protein
MHDALASHVVVRALTSIVIIFFEDYATKLTVVLKYTLLQSFVSIKEAATAKVCSSDAEYVVVEARKPPHAMITTPAAPQSQPWQLPNADRQFS